VSGYEVQIDQLRNASKAVGSAASQGRGQSGLRGEVLEDEAGGDQQQATASS
jgi:hypothetical protein